ncbi:MAG: hypothetical protein CM1200mP1_15740 [Candidatus Neomarinimicrobiota bacterium]|nr:MAG: hypothetical protein CM1200mP1_15740 [Candidatus Neomarinimicrobiota bacterium]
MANKKEYILGTNEQELNRLQLQHQVWKSEAKRVGILLILNQGILF